MCWTDWSNARNILNFFNATCQYLCAPDPWHATSGPSAHAPVAWTWPNENNIMQHLKCSTKNWPFSNFIQHVATYLRNRVAKRTRHVVSNNVARCCVEMMRAFGQTLRLKPHHFTTFIWKHLLMTIITIPPPSGMCYCGRKHDMNTQQEERRTGEKRVVNTSC